MAMTFQLPTFEQSNPAYAATNEVSNLMEQLQKIKQANIQNQYLPQTLEEKLKADQYNNQILAPQAQYAPQLTLAQLLQNQNQARLTGQTADLTAQQNKWYGSIAQSEIGERGAQTNLNNLKAKYLPLDEAIQAANSARASSRFGDAFQFAKVLTALPANQREVYVSEHPDEYQNMLNTLGNKTLQQQESYPQQVVSDLTQKMFPGARPTPSSYDVSPQAAQTLASTLVQQQPSSGTTNNQQNMTPPAGTQFSSNPQQNEEFANSMALAANQKNSGSVITNRANNAMALEGWLLKPENRSKYVPMINEAVEYAGIKGRSKKEADAWLNQHPSAISSYDWYTNTFSTYLKNGIKYLEAMGTTDQQRSELEGMVNVIDDTSSNPQRAKTAINRYISTMQDVTDGILNVAEPIKKGAYRKASGVQKLQGDYLDLGTFSSSGAVKVKSPNGKIYEVPVDKADELLKDHPDFSRVQ